MTKELLWYYSMLLGNYIILLYMHYNKGLYFYISIVKAMQELPVIYCEFTMCTVKVMQKSCQQFTVNLQCVLWK